MPRRGDDLFPCGVTGGRKNRMTRIFIFVVLTVAAAFVFYVFLFSDTPKEPARGGKGHPAGLSQGDSKERPDIIRKAEELHRETYQKRVDESLKDFESRLEGLKSDTRKAGRKVRGKLEDALDEMSRLLDDAKGKLAELKKSTGEAWDRMKEKTDASLEALEKKYRDVISRKK
jgi:ABC-type transporter Mla subunit MlaD